MVADEFDETLRIETGGEKLENGESSAPHKDSVISLPNMVQKASGGHANQARKKVWQSEPNPNHEIEEIMQNSLESERSPSSSVGDLKNRRESTEGRNGRKVGIAQKPDLVLYNDPAIKSRVQGIKPKKTKRQFVLEDAFNVEKTYTESLNVLVEVCYQFTIGHLCIGNSDSEPLVL